MLFRFRNIGKIAEADIEINGLTVLGGHNDTGKSTIGKTLYAIIKTIKDSEIEYNEFKKERIKNIILTLNVNLRKRTGFSLSVSSFVNKYNKIDMSGLINKNEVFEDLSVLFEDFKKNTLKNDTDITAEIDVLFKQATEDISEVLEEDADDSVKYKSSFTRNTIILFRGDFINKNHSQKYADIICNYSEKDMLRITVEGNITKEFLLIEKNIFEDVTLIESPIILNQSDFIKATHPNTTLVNSLFGSYNVDLISKFYYSKLDSYKNIGDSNKSIMNQISNIIEGKVYYDEKLKDFIFEQNNELKIKSINIASGIKAFGIIQLLIISGAINPNTLLIIDEPEVHLHPEWQLKYAKLITLLVDSGIYVLISSHSPYMIEALKVYSDKLKLDKITRFYVGNAHEKGTVFQDVTKDMEPLFHQLAFPMQKLTFEA